MRHLWLDRYPSLGSLICTAAHGATPNEARSLRGVQELVGGLFIVAASTLTGPTPQIVGIRLEKERDVERGPSG